MKRIFLTTEMREKKTWEIIVIRTFANKTNILCNSLILFMLCCSAYPIILYHITKLHVLVMISKVNKPKNSNLLLSYPFCLGIDRGDRVV